ncbi:MAG TPA: hypothetical protein VFH77_17510 [Streptomyces sp.]|nr:hypothetical protein [Streptomyces sp.]
MAQYLDHSAVAQKLLEQQGDINRLTTERDLASRARDTLAVLLAACTHLPNTSTTPGDTAGVPAPHGETRPPESESLADAVARMGALPVPARDEHMPATPAIGLEELLKLAVYFQVPGCGRTMSVHRDTSGDRYTVVGQPSVGARFRTWTRQGWRPSMGLRPEERYCWPDAATAVAECRRLLDEDL